jgi:glycosyltransferase involved in cell wall biosynthesis
MMKHATPLVSIGMPVFNGEQFLRRALDSLLAQDYTDFELIISDNGSTDGTEKICREYTSHDHRIRYIRQGNNLGSLENFNFVLREAQGEYFMWAAVDDQWEASFIRSLLESLARNPEAALAFCPYQLVQEETGSVLEGIWKYTYEDQRPLFRLIKFTWRYRDTCIYGLMRRKLMSDVRFTPWAWINASTPYNMAYPMIYLILSRGNFLLVGDKPLWYKSVRTTHWHSTPFLAKPLFGYLAHVLRKINLFVRSASYIYRGSKSVWLVLLLLPVLLGRFFVDCSTPIFAAIKIWRSGGKISQLSPHEIWRLGVR